MTIRTDTLRKLSSLIVAAGLAGLGAPAALADPPQGHRADLAKRQVMGERAASLGQNPVQSAPFIGRGQPDGYQPQQRTAGSYGPAAPSGESFAWGDAGIGALAGLALALLAGGALVSLRTRGRVAHS